MNKRGLIGLIILIVVVILIIGGILYFMTLKDKLFGAWGDSENKNGSDTGSENPVKEVADDDENAGAEEIKNPEDSVGEAGELESYSVELLGESS